LKKEGYELITKKTHLQCSFDKIVRKNGKIYLVEVKGTSNVTRQGTPSGISFGKIAKWLYLEYPVIIVLVNSMADYCIVDFNVKEHNLDLIHFLKKDLVGILNPEEGELELSLSRVS